MSEQKVNPSRFGWLILTTILAVAVISVAIAFWTGIFKQKERDCKHYEKRPRLVLNTIE